MPAALLATLCFSLSVIFANRSIARIGSARANLSRLALATLGLAVYSHGFGVGLHGPGLSYFLLSGVIGFGLGDLALFQTLPRLGSRLTVLMAQCLAAPLGALIEWLWLGTGISPLQIGGGCAVLAGTVIAVAPRERLQRTAGQLRWGLLFGFLSALGQGWGAVISRKAFAIDVAQGLAMNGITAAYQRILGGLAVAALAYVLMGGRFDMTSPTDDAESAKEPHRWRRALPWIGLNALLGPMLGVSCYQWALGQAPTGVVLSIVATTPLVIMPFAWVLEGDRPTPRAVGGALLAVSGVLVLLLK